MRMTYAIAAACLAAGALLGWGGAHLAGRGETDHDHDRAKREAGHAGQVEEDHEGRGEGGHDAHGDHRDGDGHGEEGGEPGSIPDSLLARAGIELDTVRSVALTETVVLPGTVRLDPAGMGRVSARFPGVVKEWRAKVGDRLGAGDLVARVESDASLEPYELRAARAGTVVRAEAAVGQSVSAGELLVETAELGTALVELKASPTDLPRLRPGLPVVVRVHPDEPGRRGTVARLLPGVDRATQMRTLLVRLPDPLGELGDGLYVTGTVEVGRGAKVLSVPLAGLQSKGGRMVVYVREGGRFEERAVATGRRDGVRVEVVSGLEAGERVAGRGSFVVKADLGKGEAGHGH